MRQPIQVLVYPVRVVDNRWEYLLLHRLVNRGDFWQGVTGGVEEGEEITVAAWRELTEETGLVPLQIQKIDYSYSFPVAEGWRHLYAEGTAEIVEYVFIAYVDGQQKPAIDHREHDQWEWHSVDQALQRLRWPGKIEALKRCDDFLRGLGDAQFACTRHGF
jgi:8-oxo-dGTP pyrophosphatase MutT (NUDIX family)